MLLFIGIAFVALLVLGLPIGMILLALSVLYVVFELLALEVGDFVVFAQGLLVGVAFELGHLFLFAAFDGVGLAPGRALHGGIDSPSGGAGYQEI